MFPSNGVFWLSISTHRTQITPVLLRFLPPSCTFSQIRKYEKERVANDSTYWLIFELLWRDFFRYSAVKNANSIFHLGGPRRDAGRQRWLDDTGSLEAWKEGETGYPFIDANMRELKASGFMSNRYVPSTPVASCLDASIRVSCGGFVGRGDQESKHI